MMTFLMKGFISQINEQRTPIRKTLGTLSPSSLNQKRIRHDVYDQGDDNSNDDNCQNDVYEQQQQQHTTTTTTTTSST